MRSVVAAVAVLIEKNVTGLLKSVATRVLPKKSSPSGSKRPVSPMKVAAPVVALRLYRPPEILVANRLPSGAMASPSKSCPSLPIRVATPVATLTEYRLSTVTAYPVCAWAETLPKASSARAAKPIRPGGVLRV